MHWIMINDKILNWENIIEFGLCGTECYYIQTKEGVERWEIDFNDCKKKQILMEYLAMFIKEIEHQFNHNKIVDLETIDSDRKGLKSLIKKYTIDKGTDDIFFFANDPPICSWCNNRCEGGITFVQDEDLHFLYLKNGEAAHLECYIELCVKHSLDKLNQN
ncbi:MAG: hypothetical protein PQJ44_07085 [Sphaerochaetaceae bacterium]|nr:hypothetical protein [Sphaerochaetaceae bacterium]